MRNKKIIGYLLILLPFIFTQYMAYNGVYLQTGSWETTFNKIFSSIPYAIGFHIDIIIAVIILIVIYKKKNKQQKN